VPFALVTSPAQGSASEGAVNPPSISAQAVHWKRHEDPVATLVQPAQLSTALAVSYAHWPAVDGHSAVSPAHAPSRQTPWMQSSLTPHDAPGAPRAGAQIELAQCSELQSGS